MADSFFQMVQDSEQPDCWTVKFTIDQERDLSPEVLAEEPFRDIIPQNAVLKITGKGPMWLYAHVAWTAVLSGVRQILTYQPDAGWTCIYPLPQKAMGKGAASWYEYKKENGLNQFLLITHTDNLTSPQVLLDEPPAFPAGIEELCIDRRGPNWMYAAAAAEAAHREIETVLCHNPYNSEGYIIIGSPNTGSFVPRQESGKPGIVLGVVGDPNSGKSVFTTLLDPYLEKIYPHQYWKYDCDAASPTPGWYLRHPDPDEAKKLRDGQKIKWTPKMEQMVAKRLRSLRTLLRVTVADLPGGYHPKDKSIPPQRLPEGREVIMREIDYFILIGRTENPGIITAWREELGRFGLDKRIIAELNSERPDDELYLEWNPETDILRGTIRGLRRTPPIQIDRVQTAIKPLLARIQQLSGRE